MSPTPPDKDLPSTVARSDTKAQDTYAETLASAEDRYGRGARASRTAYASLKRTHEKVGDHWEPKDHSGPSDEQAAHGGGAHGATPVAPTHGGVDANASKTHLYDLATRLGVRGRSSMTKAELVTALERANDRKTADARS